MTFRLTVDKQEVLLRWAAERIGMPYGWVDDSEAMGVLDASDKVVAVGVLNMVADRQGWLHIASDGNRRWANRTILGGMFSYPFYYRDLLKLTARVDIDNVASQVLCLKLGFKVEGRERAGFYGRDIAIFGMLREECGWIAPEVVVEA